MSKITAVSHMGMGSAILKKMGALVWGHKEKFELPIDRAFLIASLLLFAMPWQASVFGKCSIPVWYEQPAMIVPSTAYYGAGRGTNVSEAKAAALSELSKTLSVSVSSQVIVRSKTYDNGFGEGVDKTDIEEAIASVSNLTLRGVKTEKSSAICGESFILVSIQKQKADQQVLSQDKFMENIRRALESRITDVTSSVSELGDKVSKVDRSQVEMEEHIRTAQSEVESVKGKHDSQETAIRMMAHKIAQMEQRAEGRLNATNDNNPATSPLDLGWMHYKAKNYIAAWDAYQKAANWGNGEAMYWLGILAKKGLGRQMQGQSSVYWFKRAVEAGNTESYYFLGVLYHHGNGVKKDDKLALHWFLKAASAGTKEAFFFLGDIYENGNGVVKNLSTAAQYYKRGSDNGDLDCEKYFLAVSRELANRNRNRNNLEVFRDSLIHIATGYEELLPKIEDAKEMEWVKYSLGETQREIGATFLCKTLSKEHFTAFETWYDKAVSNGDIFAQSTIDAITKLREEKNATLSHFIVTLWRAHPRYCNAGFEQWLQPHISEGDAEVVRLVGDAYERGSYDLEVNDLKALEFYERSANLGNLDAMIRAAKYHFEAPNGISRNPKRGMDLLQIAHKRGNAEAAFRLAEYITSEGNPSAAHNWYVESATMHWEPAIEKLADNYFWGYGVKRDYSISKRLVKELSEPGNALKRFEYVDQIRTCTNQAAFDSLARDYMIAFITKKIGSSEYMAILKQGVGCRNKTSIEYLKNFQQSVADIKRWVGLSSYDLRSQVHLALEYDLGDFVQRDCKKSETLFQRAIAKNDMEATHELASKLNRGSACFRKNSLAAISLYKKALKLGKKQSARALAFMFEYGAHGAKKDLKRADSYKMSAASLGDSFCQWEVFDYCRRHPSHWDRTIQCKSGEVLKVLNDYGKSIIGEAPKLKGSERTAKINEAHDVLAVTCKLGSKQACVNKSAILDNLFENVGNTDKRRTRSPASTEWAPTPNSAQQ